MPDILGILMRWTHILSMTFILGGALYARFVLYPSLRTLGASERSKLLDVVDHNLRTWTILAVLGLFGSGMYNLLHKVNPPAGYHMWFGIKFMLALHVAAIAMVSGRPGVELAKRMRLLTGVAISGVLILALSAFLRSLR